MKKYLVTFSTEEEIGHKVFPSLRKAKEFMMNELDKRLPEELRTDNLEAFVGEDEEEWSDCLSRMWDPEEAENRRDLLVRKQEMKYTSADNSLYISQDMVLYKEPGGETVFNAEIIDLEKEEITGEKRGQGSDPYKVSMLNKMLQHETGREEHYGAHLTHWYGDTKPLTIDAGGLKALAEYYSCHATDLGNEDASEEKEA